MHGPLLARVDVLSSSSQIFSSNLTFCSDQGPFIQVMRLQPQALVICRIWVNCLYYETSYDEEDGRIYGAQRCFSI